MTFQQLAYIVEISKCGSLNKAAQNLFISQTGISTAVRSLEDELGIRLFVRSSRGAELTAAGKEFVSYAASLLSQKQRIEALFKSGSELEETSHFSVSCQRFVFVQDAFFGFLKSDGGSRLNFTYREENMEDVIDDVHDRRSDIGVISLSDFSEKIVLRILELKNLSFCELVSVTPRIFCRRDHPLASFESVSEEHLIRYPYVCYERGDGVAVEFSEEYQLFRLKRPLRRVNTNNRSTVLDLIRETDAYTIGSGLLLEASGADLVSVPLQNAAPISIGYITVKDMKLPAMTADFIEILRQSIEKSIRFTEERRI